MRKQHTRVCKSGGRGRFAKPGFKVSAARQAFAAALSVYAGGAMAAAFPAAPGPAPSGGVQFDFRCTDDGFLACPLSGTGGASSPLTYPIPPAVLPGGGTLEFSNDAGPGVCGATEGVSNTREGVGTTCEVGNYIEALGHTEGGAVGAAIGVGASQELKIDVCGTGASCPDASIPVEGIYLSEVESYTEDGGYYSFCGSDEGRVFVEWTTGSETGMDTYYWSAPNDGGEGCLAEGEQTVFVPFDDHPDEATVSEIRVRVDDLATGSDGVFVLATEDCNGGQVQSDGRCRAALVDEGNGFPDSFLTVDANPEAEIDVVPLFPIRVLDDRPNCAAGGTGPGTPLVIDASVRMWDSSGTELFGAARPVLGIDDDTAPTEFFTLSAKTCGIPRANDGGLPDPLGDPAERGPTGGTDWTPFLDIVAIEAEFDPIADTTEFRTSDLDFEPGGGPGDDAGEYACQEGATDFFSPAYGTADEDQPLFQINARPDEIKYVKGVGAPMLDPVGRDIMVGCGGSKRAISRRWSYLGYNLIHRLGVDFRAETAAEINTLSETIGRLASCIDPTYYAQTLSSGVSTASYYFNIFRVYLPYYPGFAVAYLEAADDYLRWLRWDVEFSPEEFGTCWTTDASNFTAITSTPGPNDKPLNAFGDILSQLEHLGYVLEAFRAELETP